MDRKRLLLVGLEENEVVAIKAQVNGLVIAYDTLPAIRLREGLLEVESKQVPGRYLLVDKVIYHGIFEDDFDFITLLALWGGPCLPDAHGMMDCRLRHSGLVRALRVSRFGMAPRGMSIRPEDWHSDHEVVAKWGNWHCGENKHRFTGSWATSEPTVFEPFFQGEAVRIMLIGGKAWQIRLTGDDWLKSIHHADSAGMEMDAELLADTRALAAHFHLHVCGVDYIVAHDGSKHLLEVNHIPNVTVFPFVRDAYIELAVDWVAVD